MPRLQACRSLVDTVEVETGDVTCMESTKNQLYIGTGCGRLFKYRVDRNDGREDDGDNDGDADTTPTKTQFQIRQEHDKNFRKRVTALALDTHYERLFMLCDGNCTMHDSSDLSTIFTIPPAKGCHCIALDRANIRAGEGVPHRMCVAIKRKLMIFQYDMNDEYSMLQELSLQLPAQVLAFNGHYIWSNNAKDYSRVSCKTAEAVKVADSHNQAPLICQMDNEVLIRVGCESHIYSENTRGKPSAVSKIQWDAEPVAIGRKHPYIMAAHKKGLEIYSVYEGRTVQIVPIFDCRFIGNCHHKSDKVFVATPAGVSVVVFAPVREQLRDLIDRLQITHAFDLLSHGADGNQPKQDARRQRLHVAAGLAFMKQKKLDEAFHHFELANTLDAREILLPYFPSLLPPSQPPYQCRVTNPSNNGLASETTTEDEPPPSPSPSTEALPATPCIDDTAPPASLGSSGSSGGGGGAGGASVSSGSFAFPNTSFAGTPASARTRQESEESPVNHSFGRPSTKHTIGDVHHGAHVLLASFLETKRDPDVHDDEQQSIDYALLVLYLRHSMWSRADGLLRSPNNCPIADTVSLLRETHRYRHLALLYSTKHMINDANDALRTVFTSALRAATSQLNKGEDEKQDDVEQQFTPDIEKDLHGMFFAVESGNLEYISQVMDGGPQCLHVADSGGNSPLHYAILEASQGTTDAAKGRGRAAACYLVDCGADIHVKNSHSIPAVDLADLRLAGDLRAIADVRQWLVAAPLPTPQPARQGRRE